MHLRVYERVRSLSVNEDPRSIVLGPTSLQLAKIRSLSVTDERDRDTSLRALTQ
jgi:hypothetical protein